MMNLKEINWFENVGVPDHILERARVKNVPEEIMVDTKGVVTIFLVENHFKATSLLFVS
ncbi:hypothetical protein ICL55_21880 [Chitinophaga varians]|nr:hypothetical protein [Chitinophaga varians]